MFLTEEFYIIYVVLPPPKWTLVTTSLALE